MSLLRFIALARVLTSGGGFGRRRYERGRRVRVVGCAPGCLMTSLLLSIGLTVAVNVLIRLF